MPIPDAQITVAEIVLEGRMAAGGVDSVQLFNIFYYRRVTMSIPATKTVLDAAFDNTMLDELQLVLNNRWVHVRTRIRWLNDPEDPYVDFLGGGLGTVAGDSLPSDQCVYLNLRTEKRGHRYRGSKFIGPISEADTTAQGDVLNAAAYARFQALRSKMLADLLDANGIAWEPILFTRKGSQVKTYPTTIVSNRLADVLVNKRITSLLRRKTKSSY